MTSAPSARRALALAVTLCAVAAPAQVVPWRAQTTPIPSFRAGDVAIVLDRGADAAAPAIVGVDPLQNGLFLYDLTGAQRQWLSLGPLQGVDSRAGLTLDAGRTLVVASTLATLAVLRPASSGAGLEAASSALPLSTPGAVALSRSSDGGLSLYVERGAPTVEHYRVLDDALEPLDSVELPQAPQALAVDDRTGRLYAAIPALGVYQVDPEEAPALLASVDGGFGGLVGGLGLYPLRDGRTLLLTTVPTRNLVFVHRVAGGQAEPLGSFAVGAPDGGHERVLGMGSLEVTAERLPGFDGGLLVLHDESKANYKLLGWEDVAAAFSPPLPIEPPLGPGAADAGTVDAGTDEAPDGGRTDGGQADGGANGWVIPGACSDADCQPVPRSCGCEGLGGLALPLVAIPWFIRRPRRKKRR